MNFILLTLVCFGMIAVCLCFTFLMPIVGTVISILGNIIFGEQAYAAMTKTRSDSEWRDPNDLSTWKE